MSTPSFDVNRIQPVVTVVTASHGLARRVSARHAHLQLASGYRAWETADVLAWDHWLERTWSMQCAQEESRAILLNEAQQRVLWQRTVGGSRYGRQLLQVAGAVRQARHAWRQMHDIALPIFPDGVFLNEDARAFHSWAGSYAGRCREENWIDPGELAAELARSSLAALAGGDCRELVLLGFDEITPAMKRLLDAISGKGITVSVPDAGPGGKGACRMHFVDGTAELVAAANWARNLLETDAQASIGVVVPNLRSQRSRIESIFEDRLYPRPLWSADTDGGRPFSIASGRALLDYPIVRHGWMLLALAGRGLPLAEAGILLRGPYLRAAEAEAGHRARLDAWLRRQRVRQVTMETLAHGCTAASGGEQQAGELGSAAAAVLQQRALSGGRRTLSQWVEYFTALLESWGWPGSRSLTSIEYQCLNAWQEVLRQFISLGAITGPLGGGEALSLLQQLLNEHSFQPQTPETPIQIMDLHGAADMGFEHLWVMGLHEEAWPPPPQRNPFIPLPLQREYRLPHSCADVQLEYALRLTARLQSACADVVLSWPRQEHDRSLRCSPLLAEVPESTPTAAAAPTWPALLYASRAGETFNDDTVAVPSGPVSGGAALFRDQAACPFRAFARHRLHADAPEAVDLGLDARERGMLVHRVLQYLWQDLGSWTVLSQEAPSGVDARIRRAVDQAVDRARAGKPRVFSDGFCALERQRLVELCRAWLDVERQRAPFTVAGCEQRRPFRIGAIAGELRIDRVDRLADGGEIIIDYKTGSGSVGGWEGDRPDDPQLPLYAISAALPPDGLAFAILRRGKYGFSGLAASAGLLPDVGAVSDWDTRLERWRMVLVALARDFESGRAVVDPKGPESCRHCDLHILCRVHELGRGGGGE